MAEKKTAAEKSAQPRLKALYNNELKAKLQKELKLGFGKHWWLSS